MDEDLKKCSKCKIEKLIMNFHKDMKQKDGLYKQSEVCRREYCNESLLKINKKLNNRVRIKDYYLENRDRIEEDKSKNHDKNFAPRKIYSNIRYKTDNIFRLICKTRNRIRQALSTTSKSSFTLEI